MVIKGTFAAGGITGVAIPTLFSVCELELELKLIQPRMAQKPLLWVEVGKSACVLGLCGLRISPPARYVPHQPNLWSASTAKKS